MKYKNTVRGRFISRPNRFIAYVEIDGREEVCHVKNTGRCKELLVKDATVILEKSDNPLRKTRYDLIAVYKGEELINMDSQAPNKVIGEWIENSGYFGKPRLIKPECTYKNSRFDFYVEAGERKIFAEVKGVTLEKDGVVKFPDAPTQRGVKHLTELADAVENGFEAYAIFVIQMKSCKYFTPNTDTHPEFTKALHEVSKKGVRVIALNCSVTEDSLTVDGFVEAKI
ncbi:MAG: DNA/RNA nuclease SfsA [Clostridia bacterium]|nr:DNA/RNA nuclease SfsA [Clostridia bacterium]